MGNTYCLLLWPCFCLLALTGCKPGSERARYWQAEASENFHLYPIVHDGVAILAGKCGPADCLKAVSLRAGTPVWNWLGPDSLLRKCYYNLKHYLFDDILALPIGSSLIAINLADGSTLWSHQSSWPGESFVEGIGARIFRTYYDGRNQLIRILEFDIYTGKSREIKTFAMPPVGRLSARSPSIAPMGKEDTICITGTIHFVPRASTKSVLVFWPLNDTSSLKTIEIYPENPSGDGVAHQGIVEGDRTYWVANNQVACIGMEDQNEIWRVSLPRDMLTSRLLLDDGSLFFACENEVLYALDAENGRILWQCPIAGTPSRVHVNKDKLFLIGGSDGNLYIINKKTGTLLFKYEPAELGIGNRNTLKRTFYAGNDKLIVTDYENWRAFDIQEDGSIEISKNEAVNK
ncbi:MAG: PQQ-binding-like beta-propeller repeat protein [Lewinellaceae bacterium]|nr:PQQ-binding-like beta-propeller repeat protein [Lewinellaceae bacterium]